MKCPKCGYLGFEDIERCRNCGYEFSLIQQPKSDELLDLVLRKEEAPAASSDDLVLMDAERVTEPQVPWQFAADLERPVAAPSRSRSSQSELPLFRRSSEDDAPLITKVPPPGPPLAVRRTTAEAPRVRAEPRRAPLLFDPPVVAGDGVGAAPLAADDLDEPDGVVVEGDRAVVETERAAPTSEGQTAGLVVRFAAFFLDVTVLALVDVAVIYFTLQICGLAPEEFAVLPKVPLIAFLLVQNGGYLVAFTVGGQTLGKIAAGIKVVSSDPDAPLDVGRAILRTIVWFALAVPAGLGFLTALFNPDRRGLHDQWAGTRVVRWTP